MKIKFTKSELETLYIEEHKSAREIGLLNNPIVSSGAVRNKLKSYNINIRQGGSQKFFFSKEEEEIIKELYAKGTSVAEIAKLNNTTKSVIYALAKKAKVSRVDLKNYDLSEMQRQLILGSLLGDGCITNRGVYMESHCLDQKSYIEHKAKILGVDVKKYTNKYGFSKKPYYYLISLGNVKVFTPFREKFYPGNKKRVCKEWIDALTPLGIAYWFLDDGSSSFSANGPGVEVRFSTNSFTIECCQRLQALLLRYNIETTIVQKLVKNKRVPIIAVIQKSVNDFMDLIEPYVKEIPDMMYKIKRRTKPVSNRGQASWVQQP